MKLDFGCPYCYENYKVQSQNKLLKEILKVTRTEADGSKYMSRPKMNAQGGVVHLNLHSLETSKGVRISEHVRTKVW